MSHFTQHLTLANFTCKFGDNLVLLDLASQVVIPAFLNSFERVHGDSKYFFHGVELLNFSTPEKVEYAIAGRLVKKTVVSREQKFEDGQIVKDSAELDSAPSSFFVLLLSNHKLLYVREISGAPSISTFETTATQFLRKRHVEWIDEFYRYSKTTENKYKKKDLFSYFPLPILEVTPLSTEASLTAYIEKFKTINTVEIQLLETNHELDMSPIFGRMRDVRGEIGADKISVKTEKAGEVGLNKGGVAKMISKQAEEGNSRIILSGRDLAGERFKAENDSFKVSIPIKPMPASVKAGATVLLDVLYRNVSHGVISLNSAGHDAIGKLKAVFSQVPKNE